MFENAEIEPSNLPSIDDVQWQRLDEKLVRLLVVRAIIALALIAAIVAAVQIVFELASGPDGTVLELGWLWLVPLIVAVPSLVWPSIAVPRRGYAVREKDIVFRSGVLWRSVTAIPYNRIQHVETDSAPLDRRYDIANLKIFTAGGSGGDLKIDGLPADVAERLRVFILDKIGAVVERD